MRTLFRCIWQTQRCMAFSIIMFERIPNKSESKPLRIKLLTSINNSDARFFNN